MSTNIKLFLDQLKGDNVLEAYQTIKTELSERARTLTESVNVNVAKQFNMTPIVEEKSEEEENLTDEEKEAKAAKEKEEAAGKE